MRVALWLVEGVYILADVGETPASLAEKLDLEDAEITQVGFTDLNIIQSFPVKEDA